MSSYQLPGLPGFFMTSPIPFSLLSQRQPCRQQAYLRDILRQIYPMSTSPLSTFITLNLPPASFSPGELGNLAFLAVQDLQQLSWLSFVASHQQYYSINAPYYAALHHPAMPYLHHLATHGIPAPLSSPLDKSTKTESIRMRSTCVSCKSIFLFCFGRHVQHGPGRILVCPTL
jgi:hypothetical protein